MKFQVLYESQENFSRENVVAKHGAAIAKRFDTSGHRGQHQYLTELEVLFSYKHENIIGLQSYSENMIVYEDASNRSLDKYLNDLRLSWAKRLGIGIDIAHGLAFLHGGAPTNEMVVHRDIKCANILLNGDWKAKISDFELSNITAMNRETVGGLVGTFGYVDPEYEFDGFFNEKSDIYSFGVVLFEILYGQLLVPEQNSYDPQRVSRILAQIHDEQKLGSVVFEGIKEQIAPKSLSVFQVIVSQCLAQEKSERPTAQEVLQQLKKSLEFQEDYEIWGTKLPEDYEQILKLTNSTEISYSTVKKKDLYSLFTQGIRLQDDKVCFSLGTNGERNEMISATSFSYRNRSLHDKWCVVSESRFQKVAKMLDISNLMIKIKTRTQFLSPNTIYGVHLVFKFCDNSKNISRYPMYVDLKYKKGSKTLHAYLAKWRDDDWMLIEFYRFLNQKEDIVFKFLLESLSHCRDDAIYVEGIEFRPIDNMGHNEKEIQQVMETKLNVNEELQLPKESGEIFKRSENYDEGRKLFSSSEVNGKKHLMLSAKAALHNSSNLKLFNSKPSANSRFEEVLELLPQLVIRINCTIKSQMLSPDTEYACYLVFKLTKTCQGLHCPVEVRDLLQKDKVAEIVYFKSPSPWNIHDITKVPKQRKDGWMEVNIWKFKSSHELENDSHRLNLKLIGYEGSMSGLIVCGLEFRPI